MAATLFILTVVRQQLNDLGAAYYDDSILLPYLNETITEIIDLKPDAYNVTAAINLVAGPSQSLPTGSYDILDAVCNTDRATGATFGQSLTMIEKAHLDFLVPGWLTFPAVSLASYVIKDDRTPRSFWVFPPNDATGAVSLIVSQKPADLLQSSDAFPLDDSYRPAAIDGTIYRACSENSNIAGNMTKASAYYSKFLVDLGIQPQQKGGQ